MMLTKRERFAQWRGVNANDEQSIIDTTILIEDYFTTIEDLSRIKRDFANNKTEQFIKLNIYGWRTYGSIAYCKFVIEESIELLPITATEEIRLLTELKDILGNVFENTRKNAVNNANGLIENTKKLLARDVEDITNLKQARVLCFTLYYILNLTYVGIETLGDWTRLAVNAFVDLDKIKEEIVLLLKLAEEKDLILDAALAKSRTEERSAINAQRTVQDYFNERISVLFNPEEKEDKLFIKLRASLDDISEGITSLIAARKKYQTIESNIQKIQSLLRVVADNELKIVGRKYFLDLMFGSMESFKVLMEQSKSDKKDHLLGLINQLKSPGVVQNLSSKVLYAMSWATSLVTIAYRLTIPQNLQYSISKEMPSTIDSDCKNELRELAIECLADLKQQLIDAQQEINEISLKMSAGDIELKQLIDKESNEHLEVLMQANEELGDALREYRRILFSIRQKSYFLHPFNETYSLLNHFIKEHDGWLVKLSNFFAQFFSFFKSETASLIDSARELNNKIINFETEYRKEVRKGLDYVQDNPDIPDVVKDKLKQGFNLTGPIESATQTRSPVGNVEVRDIIYNTSLFFNSGIKSGTSTIRIGRQESQPVTDNEDEYVCVSGVNRNI